MFQPSHENDPTNIKKILIEQIYSTVKWRELLRMSKENFKFIEIGPGKVLTGMVKEH